MADALIVKVAEKLAELLKPAVEEVGGTIKREWGISETDLPDLASKLLLATVIANAEPRTRLSRDDWQFGFVIYVVLQQRRETKADDDAFAKLAEDLADVAANNVLPEIGLRPTDVKLDPVIDPEKRYAESVCQAVIEVTYSGRPKT